MIQKSAVSIITGLLPGVLFIGIALYLLLFTDTAPSAARSDLRHYAMLTGAYGVWRVVRFAMGWRGMDEKR
jgi:hypothetical protein